MNNRIHLADLNKSTTNEIISTIKELNASEEETKELGLELDNTQGEIPLAFEIIEAANSTNVHLKTYSKGTLSVAGTLLAAAGQPKKRTAEVSTVFVLNDAAKENTRKSQRVSNPNADFLFMVLSELTGKKGPIKNILAEKDSITSFEAQKLGLIDSASQFKSKYELLKTKESKKEGEQSA